MENSSSSPEVKISNTNEGTKNHFHLSCIGFLMITEEDTSWKINEVSNYKFYSIKKFVSWL